MNSDNTSLPTWFDKAGAAEYIVVSCKTIRRLEISGALAAYVVPGTRTRRYRRVDLDGLLERM